MKRFFFFLYLLIVAGCAQKTQNIVEEGEPVAFKYATHIKISTCDDGYIATIRNPWDTTKILHQYLITEKDSVSQGNYTVVHTPVTNALIFTSLHASLVKTLGCKDAIKSLCDVEYVLDKELVDDVKSGRIKDLGSSMNPDIENILLQHPDVIMLSPYETSGGFGLLEKTNIPLVECADYMENSPLAQAEWIRFYGLLFNKLATADSIFAEVESNYLNLKNLVSGIDNKPTLLANSLTGAQWYMPTGNSTAGKFYVDAGFDFLFNHLQTYGTVPLNFEKVFATAYNADYWIVKYNRDKDYDLQSFSAEHPNYKDFKAFKDKNI
ncbi:MAG: ABC transporter substrate-binding protein, partial [Bacteroidales bacterium]|nr:ABC transporter substrate-binding protein [Bacteroidales bacterium]